MLRPVELHAVNHPVAVGGEVEEAAVDGQALRAVEAVEQGRLGPLTNLFAFPLRVTICVSSRVEDLPADDGHAPDSQRRSARLVEHVDRRGPADRDMEDVPHNPWRRSASRRG